MRRPKYLGFIEKKLDTERAVSRARADALVARLLDARDEDVEAIIEGARDLWNERAGDPLQCLDTAMVWLWG